MSSAELHEYGNVLAAVLTILACLICFLIESVFRAFTVDYVKLLFSEEYSYLLVVLFSVLTLTYYLIRNTGVSHEVRVSKVIAAALLADLSLVFYVSSLIELEYAVLYESLSFVLVVIALVVLVCKPLRARDLALLLSFLVLVPLPTSLSDSITLYFSRPISRVAALMTGTTFVEGSAHAQVVVETPSGPATLNVEVVSTGIMMLSSVLAVIPLITYLLAFSTHTTRKKALSVVVSLTLAFLIGFLGSLVRVLLLILSSARYGVEAGMDLLYLSPPALYSALSVLATFLVTSKCFESSRAIPRFFESKLRVRWGSVAGVLVLTLLFTSTYALVAHYVTTQNLGGGVTQLSSLRISDSDVSNFTSNPVSYVFSKLRNVVIANQSRDTYLARVLGASSVYEVSIVSRETPYSGRVEVSDALGRLHTWQLCLALQEYEVVNSWSTSVNGSRIYFIEFKKDLVRGLLGYTLVPVVAGSNPRVIAYVRVSLSKLVLDNTLVVADEITRIFSGLYSVSWGEVSQVTQSLNWLSVTSYVIVAILATYLLLVSSPTIIAVLRSLFSCLRRK